MIASYSILVYLIVPIVFQRNGANLCRAAPVGKIVAEDDNFTPSILDINSSTGDDDLENIHLNKYYKLFMRDLLTQVYGHYNDHAVIMI